MLCDHAPPQSFPVRKPAAADKIGRVWQPRTAAQIMFSQPSIDLQALKAFLTDHCRPGRGNPLSLLSAAQLLTDLSSEHLLALRQALDGAALESNLAQLIEERAAAYQ